jgi:cytochrome oxidase Cu insertion factor (SCO1/SenC/PrrC family)
MFMLLCTTGWCTDRASVGVNLHQLPQDWREDSGEPLPLARLLGHRVVMTMAYAGCHRVCPAAIEALRQMQQRADARGEVIEFVIVGYDPVNDTPGVWHRFRSNRHLDRANWHFLYGPAAAVERLAGQLGFPFWKYDEHFIHESRAVLFDAQGDERDALVPPAARWPDAL